MPKWKWQTLALGEDCLWDSASDDGVATREGASENRCPLQVGGKSYSSIRVFVTEALVHNRQIVKLSVPYPYRSRPGQGTTILEKQFRVDYWSFEVYMTLIDRVTMYLYLLQHNISYVVRGFELIRNLNKFLIYSFLFMVGFHVNQVFQCVLNEAFGFHGRV